MLSSKASWRVLVDFVLKSYCALNCRFYSQVGGRLVRVAPLRLARSELPGRHPLQRDVGYGAVERVFCVSDTGIRGLVRRRCAAWVCAPLLGVPRSQSAAQLSYPGARPVRVGNPLLRHVGRAKHHHPAPLLPLRRSSLRAHPDEGVWPLRGGAGRDRCRRRRCPPRWLSREWLRSVALSQLTS